MTDDWRFYTAAFAAAALARLLAWLLDGYEDWRA